MELVIVLNIRDSVTLDHFFLMVKPVLFEQLKELSGIMKNTVYERVERPDTWYEGIYVFAENKTYFELLNNPEDNYNFYLGVGWSSKNPSIIDVDRLPEEFPYLEWQKLEIRNQDNEPWYDAFMLPPIDVPYPFNFTTWAVKYHSTRKTRKNTHFTIQKFVSMEFDVPEAYLKLVKQSSQWFPQRRTITKEKAILTVPQGENDLFKVILNVDSSLDNPKSVELRAKLCSPDWIFSKKLGSMTLYSSGDEVIFSFANV